MLRTAGRRCGEAENGAALSGLPRSRAAARGGAGWHAAARVWSACDSAPFRYGRRLWAGLLWAGLLSAGLLGVASPARAEASGEATSEVMTERSGFSFDVRLTTGPARAEFTESDYPVATFEALAIGGAARLGWFLGQHVLLGAELAGSWHGGVGSLRIHDPSYFSGRELPTQASYSVVAPLGVFVELYPLANEGWFLGVSGGIGGMGLPSFAGDSGALLSGYSLETGYELSGSAKIGFAPFLRYSVWAGEETPISTDHPDGILSRELLLGARWSFWTPSWR